MTLNALIRLGYHGIKNLGKEVIFKFINLRLFFNFEAVYRHLGDSNSQWHKKNLQKVPVGGSAS